MLIYGAYGSNLNKLQMRQRCPAAQPWIGYKLENWSLVFKGVADIEKKKGCSLLLGLYKITSNCQEMLDYYEEYPEVYSKRFIKLYINNKITNVMLYEMIAKYKYAIPTVKYYEVIKKGYEDWNFNNKKLIKAGLHSLKFDSGCGYESKNWRDEKNITSAYLKN